MEDRDVKIIIPMKHSQVAESRALVTGLELFPGVVMTYIKAIVKCLEGGTCEDGREMGRLIAELRDLAAGAREGQLTLREIIGQAVISDPDGREGRLQ